MHTQDFQTKILLTIIQMRMRVQVDNNNLLADKHCHDDDDI